MSASDILAQSNKTPTSGPRCGRSDATRTKCTMLTAVQLTAFRDAVAADVASQYPHTDYIKDVVAVSIQDCSTLLGWQFIMRTRPNGETWMEPEPQ